MRVFLSHRSPYKAWTEELGRTLRAHGVDAWLDKWEIRPGDSIVDRIDEGLTNCDCLLLVLTPDSVDGSARWVKTEWQAYLSAQLSQEESKTRLIPLLLRDTTIPSVLQHIKYIDFRNEAEFYDRFLELFNALHGILDRPPLDLDDIDTVRRKIQLTKYKQAGDAMAELEEASARFAGRSRVVVPGENQSYPLDESRALFRQAFEKLQRFSRERAWFSKAALAELQRTVAMIETMNIDFDFDLIKPVDRPRLREEHRKDLERRLVDLVAERNRAFCSLTAEERVRHEQLSSFEGSIGIGHETPNPVGRADAPRQDGGR